jgi:hypothetical protein
MNDEKRERERRALERESAKLPPYSRPSLSVVGKPALVE